MFNQNFAIYSHSVPYTDQALQAPRPESVPLDSDEFDLDDNSIYFKKLVLCSYWVLDYCDGKNQNSR